MAPEVEPVQRFTEHPRINYFTVDLSIEESLDPNQFDQAVRQIVDDPDREGAWSVKFMVYGDRLVVLPTWLYFYEAYGFLAREGAITGKLKCIGDMRLDGEKRTILKIPGHGMEDLGLPTLESDRFRDGQLIEKLGPDFTIEDPFRS